MTTTVDHVGIAASDYEKSKAFYTAALAPLGLTPMMDFGVTVGYGAAFPFNWQSGGNPGHAHLALRADSRKLVDDFYAAAIKAGGKDNGKPWRRTEYSANYYAAFALDPDGHNIEAVCHAPA